MPINWIMNNSYYYFYYYSIEKERERTRKIMKRKVAEVGNNTAFTNVHVFSFPSRVNAIAERQQQQNRCNYISQSQSKDINLT